MSNKLLLSHCGYIVVIVQVVVVGEAVWIEEEEVGEVDMAVVEVADTVEAGGVAVAVIPMGKALFFHTVTEHFGALNTVFIADCSRCTSNIV